MVVGAVGEWNQRCGALIPSLGTRQRSGSERWVVKLDPHLQGCGRARKWLGSRTISLNPNWHPNCDLRMTLKHEIGHALGLGDIYPQYHPECRGNIMWYAIGGDQRITRETCLGVREAWKGIDSETPSCIVDGCTGGGGNPGGGADPGGIPGTGTDRCVDHPNAPGCETVETRGCPGQLVLKEGGDPDNADDWECLGEEI